ncbi:MAG TPA: hypothetical protein VME46_22970, partial [Acidimicrobiales bacterium]|nr:hypothetical protein [Acidimicrobiales bacterium]
RGLGLPRPGLELRAAGGADRPGAVHGPPIGTHIGCWLLGWYGQLKANAAERWAAQPGASAGLTQG